MSSKLTKDERLLWDTLKFSYDRGALLETNAEILEHVLISQKIKKVTEPLANAMINIAKRMLKKKGFTYYVYRDDLIGEAVKQMCISVMIFNPKKIENVYAYLDTVCTGAFMRVLHTEKKQEELKEELKEELIHGSP